ncbi:Uncharacterised protein [Mycobacteroides abscessus subsp. abscessus]|nr:Uncharacterised protein [Mycobacteroides abscessus subsp. abscessus]
MIAPQHVQHRVHGGQRFAYAALELLADLHELGVGTDARRIDHHLALVQVDQVDSADTAPSDRVDGLGHALAADVLGEVIEGAAGENRQRPVGLDRHTGSACHRAVAASHREHLRPARGRTHHFDDVIVLAQLDNFGARQRFAHLFQDPLPGAIAGRRIDHQYDTLAPGPCGCFHPQRLARRNRRRHDRRHHARAQDCQSRTDPKSREDVAGVVDAGRHPGQPHQTGEQREPKAQRRAFQADSHRERRGTRRMP